jgi:hypothetical protein
MFSIPLFVIQTFLLRAQNALCSGKMKCSSAKSFMKALGDPILHGIDNMILSNITKQIQSSSLKIHVILNCKIWNLILWFFFFFLPFFCGRIH